MTFAEITEAGVWFHIPADIPLPSQAPDRPGAIRAAEFERLKSGVLTELAVRFTRSQAEEAHWGHDLVRDASEMLVAARILRRVRSYQEIADSLFADANVKIRLWFEGVVGKDEHGTGAELLVIGEEGVDQAQRPWLHDPNDMVDGFRPLPVDRDDRANHVEPDYLT